METNESGGENEHDRGGRRGTWLWFVVNVLLFPGPAYFTLLRVREVSFGGSAFHVSISLFLLFLIPTAALLQIVTPSIGQFWMLLPILSGVVVLFMNRSLKSEFHRFDCKTVGKKHYVTLSILLLVFLVGNSLPELDLIAINEPKESLPKSSFQDLPLWQDLIIILIGTLVIFVGYISNTARSLSINRVIILYSCFLILSVQLFILLETIFRFFKLTGGFGSVLGGILLTSVLAVDYYDASTFGQYARRYFLLTCTKGVSFVLLWLCFLGLPQLVASMYATRAYEKVHPLHSFISCQDFVFPYRERFSSEHEAHRRLRSLYSHALQRGGQARLEELQRLVAHKKGTSLQTETDVSTLQHTVSRQKVGSTNLPLEDLPFFRPVQVDWDVHLSAIMLQGGLDVSDLDQSIATFKASLPRGSDGQLPTLNAPFQSRYVAHATGMQVNFVPPDNDIIEALMTNDLIPLLYLHISGNKRWAAVVHFDKASGIVWLRLENTRKLTKAIQVHFDAGESEEHSNEILANQYVPLSMDYLSNQIKQMSDPVIVFSREGLHVALPDIITAQSVETMNRAVAEGENNLKATDILKAADSPLEFYSGYAGYLNAMAHIQYLLTPSEFAAEPFLQDSQPATSIKGGMGRIQRVAWILSQLNTLRDEDRMNIAYKLSTNDHVAADPELFIKLAADLPFSSDLVGCSRAFVIGRALYLLGRHQEALDYLTISFYRHPFSSKYEMWYRIALLKLGKPVPPPYSLPSRRPDLHLYYQTMYDMKDNNGEAARKRLEAALEKDSHNILVNQLMHRYFNQPLDGDYFFQASEGL